MSSIELDVTGTDGDDDDDDEDDKDDEEIDLPPKRPSTPFDGEQTSANTDDDDDGGRESVNRSFLEPQKENEPNENISNSRTTFAKWEEGNFSINKQ